MPRPIKINKLPESLAIDRLGKTNKEAILVS